MANTAPRRAPPANRERSYGELTYLPRRLAQCAEAAVIVQTRPARTGCAAGHYRNGIRARFATVDHPRPDDAQSPPRWQTKCTTTGIESQFRRLPKLRHIFERRRVEPRVVGDVQIVIPAQQIEPAVCQNTHSTRTTSVRQASVLDRQPKLAVQRRHEIWHKLFLSRGVTFVASSSAPAVSVRQAASAATGARQTVSSSANSPQATRGTKGVLEATKPRSVGN